MNADHWNIWYRNYSQILSANNGIIIFSNGVHPKLGLNIFEFINCLVYLSVYRHCTFRFVVNTGKRGRERGAMRVMVVTDMRSIVQTWARQPIPLRIASFFVRSQISQSLSQHIPPQNYIYKRQREWRSLWLFVFSSNFDLPTHERERLLTLDLCALCCQL